MSGFVIIHVSDLHLTRADQCQMVLRMASLRQTILDSIREAGIDALHRFLVISGDFAETSADAKSPKVHNEIESFRKGLGVADDSYLVVPGNHDCARDFGMFRKEPITRYPFPTTISAPQHHFYAVGFDTGSLGELATGRLDGDGFRKACQEARALDRRLGVGKDDPFLKVAVVHHHPLPIAQGERERVGGLPAEPGMIFGDAGHFLRMCVELEFDLVLHGHRHVSEIHGYRRLTKKGVWQNLTIASAPSGTGKDSRRGDSGFNLVVHRHGMPVVEITRHGFNFIANGNGVVDGSRTDLDPECSLLIDVYSGRSSDWISSAAHAIHYQVQPNNVSTIRNAVLLLAASVSRAGKLSLRANPGIDALLTLRNLWIVWESSVRDDLKGVVLEAERNGITNALHQAIQSLVMVLVPHGDINALLRQVLTTRFMSVKHLEDFLVGASAVNSVAVVSESQVARSLKGLHALLVALGEGIRTSRFGMGESGDPAKAGIS